MPATIRCCASFCGKTSWRYPRQVSPNPAIHGFAWHNGALAPASGVQLSPFQTGLLTGWGLFSTLRIYGGVPFALEAHWERLCIDAAKLHVAIEDLWPEVKAGFEALVEKNQAEEAVARIYFIRNRGGLLDMPGPRPTDLLIFTRALRSWGTSAKLRLQPNGRHAAAPLAGTKTLTWAHNLVLVEEAAAAGFDDVLLLNERGEVAECTSANVFVGRSGKLSTPPLSSGALPGVSRRVLLEAAPRHGLLIEERTLKQLDLEEADEIFITSSTREVQPVTQIDGNRYAPGRLAERAEQVFQQVIHDYVQPRRTQREAARTSV